MKVCTKCKIEKELSEFIKEKQNKDGYKGQCKLCMKEYKKEYKKEYQKKYYKDNKEIARSNMKEYYKKNKDKLKQRQKEYYENNRDKVKEYAKEYSQNNKDKLNKYRNERMKNDPLFKMKCRLRIRTCEAFKSKFWYKNNTTQKMLGCDFETAHKHLERQFTKGMNWENQGEWHIDHIIPLASVNTKSELIKLCHYTNLQPLWSEDNLSKGATMPNVQIKLRI